MDSAQIPPFDWIGCDARQMNAIDTLWSSLADIRFDDTAVEAAVEDRLIRPLIGALNWPDECVHSKVRADHRIGRKIQPGRSPEADYVLGEPTDGHVPPKDGYVVIESKRPGEDFSEARGQAESYSFALRSLLYVVCDGRLIEVWRTGWATGTKMIIAASTERLLEHRADLELILSPGAVKDYYDQQKPPQIRANYNLAEYFQYVRAHTAAFSAVRRRLEMTCSDGRNENLYIDS